MKAIQLASFGIIPVALLIAACGDDVTKVTKIEETSGMEVVASADSLGKCTAEISGEMKFATKENAVYVCADSVWKNVSKVEKAACSAETLADSSGFKIVCDGDSVGVVRNGTDGKDGRTGEKGDVGENCELSDGGDGTVSVVCGADTINLYKAFCDGKLFNPDSSFCFSDSIISLCGGKSYDLDFSFCAEELVAPQTKKLVWDLMNPEIEYGMFTDERDGQVYRSVKIGEQTWMAENLNYAYNKRTFHYDSTSFCYDNKPDSCAKYGRYYLWNAAMDSAAIFSDAGEGCGYNVECGISDSVTVRGVCPEGWHLPGKAEFETLIDAVGGIDVAGKALKSASGWEYGYIDVIITIDSAEALDKAFNAPRPGYNGTDAFGFSALPAGYRSYSYESRFVGDGFSADFWTVNGGDQEAYSMSLSSDSEKAAFNFRNKDYGHSVRCVRD